MKTHLRFLLVFLLAGLGLGVFAQFNVVVFAPNGEKFTLYISGSQQNSEPAYRVEANNPGGPTFKIRVFFANASLPEINKTVFNKPGNNMYYKVGKNSKGVYILEATESEWTDKGVAAEESVAPPPAKTNADQEKAKASGEPAKSTGKKGCDQPMPDGDFTASLVGISSGPFDPIKLSNAKKTAEKHCLSVLQITTIIYAFDSESTRLSFAKFAYDYAYNPEDYAEVKDALHSQKSKDDLDRYIAGKK